MHIADIAKYRNIIGPQVREFRLLKGWTQVKLAAELRAAGFRVTRGDLAKIEARIIFIKDFELQFLVEVLEVDLLDLFPKQLRAESADGYLKRTMSARYDY